MSVVSGLHPAGAQISTITSTANQAPLSTAVQPDSSFAPITELQASAASQNPAQQRSYDQQKLEAKHLTYQLETIEQTRQQNVQIQQQGTGLNDQLLSLAENSSQALQGENNQAKEIIAQLNIASDTSKKETNVAGATTRNTDEAVANTAQKSASDAPDKSENIETDKVQKQINAKAEAQELAQIRKLSERDIEVKNHEQAHKNAAGQYGGQMTLEFVQGPDGRRYAVGGEVSIDISVVAGDPRATISKMDQIKRAALSPAEPSSQDRQVAAEAARIRTVAQQELLLMVEETSELESELKVENDEKSNVVNDEKDNNSEEFQAMAAEKQASSTSDFGKIDQNEESSESSSGLSGFINTFIPSSSIDEQLQSIDLFKAQADKLGRNLDLII
jgi:hypothetical protein